MTIQEKTVLSTDGIHTLHGYVYVPDGEVRALVQFVHGMAEHIERYDPIMKYLCEKGFVCFGHDHIGHGRSVNSPEEKGYFAPEDGYKILYRDVSEFSRAVRADYPGKKRFLLGHSMGSFVVRLAAAREKEELDGLIIMGTAGSNPAAPVGKWLARRIAKKNGEKSVSPTINKLSFGSYNKKTEGRTPFDWLSFDKENVDRYIADPDCGFDFTVSGMIDLVTLTHECNLPAWYEEYPKSLPTLLVSGTEDPVGSYGKGVREVCEKLKKAGVSDVSMILYPDGRHEILLDNCKEKVFEDLSSWLLERA
ncbi:MAG: alpha/beta hydrolase [Clostridia bacterium]|nr:alpha/beta hydrolase [Clostridia bacterium]